MPARKPYAARKRNVSEPDALEEVTRKQLRVELVEAVKNSDRAARTNEKLSLTK